MKCGKLCKPRGPQGKQGNTLLQLLSQADAPWAHSLPVWRTQQHLSEHLKIPFTA